MPKTTERTVHLSSAQVEAIQKGRMTLIVQLMAPQPPADALGVGTSIFSEPDWEYRVRDPLFGISVHTFACPYGNPGDVLVVDPGDRQVRLEVLEVRLWRIQQIRHDEAIACGLYDLGIDGARYHWDPNAPRGYYTPLEAVRAYWNSTYTLPGTTWADNPWAWAVSVAAQDPLFGTERRG
jgi:hypothetical protein